MMKQTTIQTAIEVGKVYRFKWTGVCSDWYVVFATKQSYKEGDEECIVGKVISDSPISKNKLTKFIILEVDANLDIVKILFNGNRVGWFGPVFIDELDELNE